MSKGYIMVLIMCISAKISGLPRWTVVKNLRWQETQFQSLSKEDPLNPFHYCCLEKSMDRGAWQATVHAVTKSQIKLSMLHHCIRQI